AIDPRIAAGAGGMPGKQRDDDKRQDDRGRRPEQIKRQRQRQLVALTEAMRRGRGREGAARGERGARLVQPAPAWCVLRDAPLRGAPQDDGHLFMASKNRRVSFRVAGMTRWEALRKSDPGR